MTPSFTVSRLVRAVVLTLLPLVAACGQQAPTTQAPTGVPAAILVPSLAPTTVADQTAPPAAPELVGPTWLWQGTTMNDGSVTTVADPSRYTLMFGADGALSIKADCNRVVGTYTRQDETLTLLLGPTTLAACPEDSQADIFVQGLGNVGSFMFDAGQLYLMIKFDSGTMRFALES